MMMTSVVGYKYYKSKITVLFHFESKQENDTVIIKLFQFILEFNHFYCETNYLIDFLK